MFHVKHYDVIVIGGGHAGCEAAAAAARIGANTALITLKADNIGVMSCNPAMGGLGKGHIVREVDAMGGLIGQASDRSGIQFRLLNRRKGPAVQGPRLQVDRELFKKHMQHAIHGLSNLSIVTAEVADLATDDQRVTGVILADGETLASHSVVITTGTFLRGVIHLGYEKQSAGRVGERPATKLARRLESLNISLGRLKTGTPPRLLRSSIDWDSLPKQPGDDAPTFLSFLTQGVENKQIACAITHTNQQTHDIIEEHLQESAIYGGRIDHAGPRYCPSIEDKVVRFGEKSAHQIFLEPESLTTDLIYPNGISTSLSAETQMRIVRSIVGLDHAEIAQPGYAIEYDYVDPRSLTPELELKSLSNLYLAGQINGTTGYEEAAGQGVVAGINAARKALGQDPFQLSRTESYIGVMIDDLITRGVTEPYRMFTSRAENRLYLRCDNADQRLTEKAHRIGLIDEVRWRRFSEKMEELSACRNLLQGADFSSRQLAKLGANLALDGPRRNGFEAVLTGSVTMDELLPAIPSLAGFSDQIRYQIGIEARYSTYIDRQQQDNDKINSHRSTVIPNGMDFRKIPGLSNELAEKLSKSQPQTIAQAERIEGITPAALLLILSHCKRAERGLMSSAGT